MFSYLILAASFFPTLVAESSNLIISGVIDGPLRGGTPKAIELFVLDDIADLSIYGIGSTNNGEGTDGEEYTFPPVSVSGGSSITIATDSVGFTDYFGISPTYIDSVASINGDDAIELFLDGVVVDTYGQIDVDGTGEDWEYVDGWAYRKNVSSPSEGIFQFSEWTFSGPNALDGCLGNDWCDSVYPLNSYYTTTTPSSILEPTVEPGIITKIHEIQGTGSSVIIDFEVTVQAIVTGLIYTSPDSTRLAGFFVQEEDFDADSDPDTSEGIFVYCGSGSASDKCNSIASGDKVNVTGIPRENYEMSQIDASFGSIIKITSEVPLPTPIDLTLPANGSTKSSDTFEFVEGMLVRFPGTLVVSEYYNLARFGEIVLTFESRPFQFTHENNPDVDGYANFLDSLGARRIILDDDSNIQNPGVTGTTDKPYTYPTQGGFPIGGLSLTNKMRGGDTIESLTGVMHWSWAGSSRTDAWRLRPISGVEYSFTPVNVVSSTTPEDVGGSLKVASFNVLNYFTTLDDRGANSNDELDRQKSKIVAAMVGLNADILGLIEIENSINDEATSDLVSALNDSFGVGTYSYLETGVIGSDAIKNAFIYKTATVQLIGDYFILDSSIDHRFIDDKNRPGLIQTFKQISSGGILTIAINHFKSKGSSCDSIGDPNLNDGQANCPQTRANAALALADYLLTDPTGSGDSDFLIIGDLNAYKKEDAITNLLTRGYIDLASPNEYSYVNDGQLGYLDYALANKSLLGQVTGFSEWHVNADEIPLFDYNDCSLDGNEVFFHRKSCANGDLYLPDALRSSDHDPVLIGFDLTTSELGLQQVTMPSASISPSMSLVPTIHAHAHSHTDEHGGHTHGEGGDGSYYIKGHKSYKSRSYKVDKSYYTKGPKRYKSKGYKGEKSYKAKKTKMI